MQIKTACIFGGSGFIGRHLIAALSSSGIQCTVISRHPERHSNLKLLGAHLLQISDYSKSTLNALFRDFDLVINLLGILNEGKNSSFDHIHVEIPSNIAEAARLSGVKRLIHLSALNAHETKGTSQYLRSKGKGENNVMTLSQPGVAVTCFRPSVIFGADDSFYNRFAKLLAIPGPFFPLACANSQFSPVFISDVVEAIMRSLYNAATYGKSYDLCGPQVYSLKQIVSYTAEHAGIGKTIISLPSFLGRAQARILGKLPGKPFSLDNYDSCQMPSVCKTNGLQTLGIKPTHVDAIIPKQLSQTERNTRYSDFRRLSGRD